MLRQIVRGLKEIPEEISQAYEDHKKVIDGRRLKLADIVKMLQVAASGRPTFICIDALDECAARYRVTILDSLNKILQSCTRMFMTGRPHIEPEVGKYLAGRVTALRITPQRHDIICYLHRRLEDAAPDAMDYNLKEDILKKIPEDISEM